MIISEAEKARIAEAIGTAELKTAGEIFCVIAHSSSSYRLVPVAWAALIALAMPLPLIYLTNWPAGRIYLLQLLGFIVSGIILSLPALRFRIVPKRAMHDRAHVEAIRQFLAQGIHLTEHRTGVPDLRIGRRTSCRDRCGLWHQCEGHAGGLARCG